MTSRHPGSAQGTPPVKYRRHLPGMMPFLSLFLLLLTFFMMINSMSRLEVTRTQAILGSLGSTFRSTGAAGLERKLGSASGPFLGAEELEASVTDLLRTAAGVDVFEVFRAGNTLTVFFGINDLFVGDSSETTGAVGDLAELFAEALAEEPVGIIFEITVLLHARTPSARTLASARGAAIGVALLKDGVERSRLAVGIGGGDPSQMQILLRVLAAEADRSGIALRGDGDG